ncbi:unnamed protein product, partial [Ixodes hexagonus]
EPQTTKIKNASNHGPTGYFSRLTVVLGTFPRSTTFLLAFSLAIRILWLLTMMKACGLIGFTNHNLPLRINSGGMTYVSPTAYIPLRRPRRVSRRLLQNSS